MRQYLMILAAVLIVGPLTAVAIEGQAGTEPPGAAAAALAAAQQRQVEEPGELELLIQQLNRARKAGDAELAYALQAQIPRPETEFGGEVGGGLTTRASGAYGGLGDPGTGAAAPDAVTLGFDVKVSGFSSPDVEWNPDMASASNGDLYSAWQDDLSGDDYIQVYKSTDGGSSWVAFGFVGAAGSDLVEPSIAIGEGSTGDLVLIAYIVDDGVQSRYVEVASAPLGGGSFTIHAVTGPAATNWDFYKPTIFTDSHSFGVWWAYLTAGAIFDNVATNHNVTAWRATDGVTFDTPLFIWGDNDALTWRDPHGTFGTSGLDPFVACYNDSDDTLYIKKSLDLGTSYEPQVAIFTMTATYLPVFRPVEPEIAAAINHNNVMLTCTRGLNGVDTIGQTYSTDGGATWTTLWAMDGYNATEEEFAVALTAGEGGQNWHVAYTTRWKVWLTQRPQDLSDFWNSSHLFLNDTDTASIDRSEKGIAADWTSDVTGVVWSDYRDTPDYYIYYDDDFFFIIIIPIFFDGFESGNTSAWDATVP